MKNTRDFKQSKKQNILGTLGFTAGIINGFFGSGGGMIVVESMERSGLESRRAHASSILAILPLSIVSAVVYYLRGSMHFDTEALYLLFGACFGGMIGALLLGKLSPKWIDALFTILMLISGIRILFA